MEDQIEFLLNEEKKQIEQDMVDKHMPFNELSLNNNEGLKDSEHQYNVISQASKVKKDKRTKAQLVEEFIELQNKTGEILYSENKLKHMTKEMLLKNLANYANDILLMKKPVESVETVEAGINEVGNTLDPNQLNLIASGLFSMNLALANTLETSSIYMKDKTAGVPLLSGWTEDIVSKREQFLTVFKAIYAQHKEALDKYLTPMSQYAILMSTSAAQVIFDNVRKKKEKSEEPSIDINAGILPR